MDTDTRFKPPPANNRHCLNCKHHVFEMLSGMVGCNHPQRPQAAGVKAAKAEVLRWFVGCPQHEPKEST